MRDEMIWITRCLMASDVQGRIALDTLQLDYLLAMLGSPTTSAAVRTAVRASTSAASRHPRLLRKEPSRNTRKSTDTSYFKKLAGCH